MQCSECALLTGKDAETFTDGSLLWHFFFAWAEVGVFLTNQPLLLGLWDIKGTITNMIEGPDAFWNDLH